MLAPQDNRGIITEFRPWVRAVIVGTIKYPKKVDFTPKSRSDRGRIIVAKAVLTPDMPLRLARIRISESRFP